MGKGNGSTRKSSSNSPKGISMNQVAENEVGLRGMQPAPDGWNSDSSSSLDFDENVYIDKRHMTEELLESAIDNGTLARAALNRGWYGVDNADEVAKDFSGPITRVTIIPWMGSGKDTTYSVRITLDKEEGGKPGYTKAAKYLFENQPREGYKSAKHALEVAEKAAEEYNKKYKK